MRNRVKFLLLAVAGLIAPIGLAPTGGAQAAAATSAVTLPITGFYQMAVDAAHGHIFFSQDRPGQGILVTDLTGQVVTTVTGQTGVVGITLSPDGSTLYAALGSGGAVTAISTATLTQSASYPMPAGDSPVDVAVQSGKIWVSYYTGTAAEAAIGYFDPSAASPALQTPAAMGGWDGAPQLAADPQDTGVLVAAGTGTSGYGLASYDTAADPVATRAGSPAQSPNCADGMDLAVAPGGAEFAVACQQETTYDIRSTADLSPLRSLDSSTSGHWPQAVAYDGAGDLAAGASVASPNGDVAIYPPGGMTALNAIKLYAQSIGGGNLQPRGLAWLPDGSQLFGVLQAGTQSRPYVLVPVANPAITVTTLSLTAPSTADITEPLSLAGTLTGSTGAPLPAGTPIAITRSAADGTAATFNVTTAADGSFTLTDTPPALGTYSYTASYGGSAASTASSASQTVTVTRIPTSLTLTTPSAVLAYQPTFSVTAHLGTTDTNRTVSIYAQPDGGGTATLLKTATVDATGNLTVSYTAPHSTTFTAVFAGDADYAPVTVPLDVIVTAKVSESVSGSYGSKKVSGITYRLFHHTKPLTVSTTVTPDKAGQCITIEIQEHYSGAWQPNSVSDCVNLSRSSKATGLVDGSHADLGFPYRIRIDYSGDATNGASNSAWSYVMIKK
jgi:hypothetical protein